MGVANLLDDNLVHYIFFQFSGIESAGMKERKKSGKEQCSVDFELVV